MFRVLFSSIFIAVILFMLGSCRGSRDSTPENLNSNNFTLPENQVALIDESTKVFAETLQTKTPQAACEALVSFIQGKPEIAASGISDDGQTVWIRFADGGTWAWMVYSEDIQTQTSIHKKNTSGFVSQAIDLDADISHFPSRNKASILGWPEFQKMCLEVEKILGSRGYDVNNVYEDKKMTPNEFKKLAEYDFVYINTHGGIIDGKTSFLTIEEIKVTEEGPSIPEDYLEDYRNNRVYVVNLLEEEDQNVYVSVGTFLAINTDFMKQYLGNFRKNAGIFANACKSLNQEDMANLLIEKGAGVYVGFKYNVLVESNCDIEILKYLKGDSELPMNLSNSILSAADCVCCNWTNNLPYNVLNCTAFRGDPEWGLIPHLDSFKMEGNTITLDGSFGSKQDQVLVNNSNATIFLWTEPEIQFQSSIIVPQGVRIYIEGIIDPYVVYGGYTHPTLGSNVTPIVQNPEAYGYQYLGRTTSSATFNSSYISYLVRPESGYDPTNYFYFPLKIDTIELLNPSKFWNGTTKDYNVIVQVNGIESNPLAGLSGLTFFSSGDLIQNVYGIPDGSYARLAYLLFPSIGWE